MTAEMPAVGPDEIDDRLARFVEKGLMIARGPRYLSIALPEIGTEDASQ